jgi:acrylyl-CoA reductase (NADPH)
MAGGTDLPTSVIPFILRGVSLIGIDSVMRPYEARVAAWERLSTLFVPAAYEEFVREARLEDLPELAGQVLKGSVAGRVIINPRD